MYVANHYIRVNGKILARGERLPMDVTQAKLDWLLSAGAIKEVKPAEQAKPEPVKPEPVVEPVVEPAIEAAEEPVEEVEIDSMAGVVTEPPKKKKGGAKK